MSAPAASAATARDGAALAPAVEAVAAAVQVGSSGDVTVAGSVVALGSAPRRERLRALERVLYERFHSGRPPVAHAGAYPDEDFREALERAVQVQETTEGGWRVLRVGAGVVEAERGGLRLHLHPRHLVAAGPAQLGGEIEIRLPPTRPGMSPGYFTVLGPEGGPRDGVGRLYANLPSASAAAFLERLTGTLRHERARWAVKTLADPRAYGRRDGTVIYVEAATRDVVARRARDALADLPVAARPDIPPLTLALSPTLGYADEPAGRTGRVLSFGQHRMNAIADALLRQRTADFDRRRRYLRAALLRAGIDPQAPYRNRQETIL